MMKSLKGSWSEDDVERLRRHIEGGGSAGAASVRFRRSEQAVRTQARAMGLRFPTIRERREKAFGTTTFADRFSNPVR